jgi:hypothetical protein
MSLRFELSDPCPKCGKPLTEAVVELHPSRGDIVFHNFTCADCGPVRTRAISLNPLAQPSEARA